MIFRGATSTATLATELVPGLSTSGLVKMPMHSSSLLGSRVANSRYERTVEISSDSNNLTACVSRLCHCAVRRLSPAAQLVRASAEAGAAAVGLPRSRASDATAHALGAALALSEALLRATESFDAARARRCAVALQRSKGADAGAAARFFADPGNAERVAARVAAQVADEDELHHDHERPPPQEQQQQQQQQRAEAVSAVHARLAETLTASRMAERSALELQAMSQVLSSHVARQAEQIEALYESAVAASANLAAGNVELSKAKERTGQATRYSVWAMVIAGLLLLLMDWMLP